MAPDAPGHAGLPAGNQGVGKWGLGRVAQNETLIRDGQRGMVVDIRIDIGRREGASRGGDASGETA